MTLTEEKVREIIEAGTPAGLYENRRVLVLTPDGTRTCPLPMMVRILREVIGARAARLDFMVALGTHPIMTDEEILKLYGINEASRKGTFGQSSFFCHRWDRPETFQRIGELTEEDVAAISGGLLRERVPIDINKMIFDYDLIFILG
ncbi:MAG: hypothetical protein CO013_10020, partial [Syntrophobacterales bacterium CG_4_8_14_3_um_filter_58_8]